MLASFLKMAYSCTLTFTSIFLILIGASAFAQEIDDDFDPFDPESTPYSRQHWAALIKMDYRAYDVPLKIAEELMRNRKFEGHDDELLERLVGSDNARLVDISTLSGRPGETCSIESVTEIIYETEYEPGYPEEQDQKGEKAESKITEATTSNIATPTAFETRDSGLTLEIEPSLGDRDNVVDFRFVYEDTELIRFEPIVKSRQVDQRFPFSLPVFYTQRINTFYTVGSGHSILVGITTPLNEQKSPSKTHRRLLFMTITVDRVKPQHDQ